MIKKCFFVELIAFVFLGLLYIYFYPTGLNSLEATGYNLLLLSHTIMFGVLIWATSYNKIDLFDLYIPFFVCDYLCLVLSPIVFLVNNTADCHGLYIMDGCAKATFVHIVAFTSFSIFYFCKNTDNIYKIDEKVYEDKSIPIVLSGAILLWWIFFAVSLLYIIFSGKSLMYILTLGFNGEASNNVSDESSFKFLINFSYCLIGLWLYILNYSNNRIFRVFVTVMTAIIYLIRGTRFIVVLMAMSYFVFYYFKNRRYPKVRTLVTIVIAFLVFITLMGYSRTGLRSGMGINIEGVGLDAFYHALETNFDIYKTYYGVVVDVPNIIGYSFGKALCFDTLAYMVPRFLWPSKPTGTDISLFKAMIESLSYRVVNGSSMSTVWLTELYIDFGYLGAIIVPAIYGAIMCRWKKLYKNYNGDILSIIMYSILYGSIMQLVTRGYMSMNFWMLVFLLLPCWLLSFIRRTIIRSVD